VLSLEFGCPFYTQSINSFEEIIRNTSVQRNKQYICNSFLTAENVTQIISQKLLQKSL